VTQCMALPLSARNKIGNPHDGFNAITQHGICCSILSLLLCKANIFCTTIRPHQYRKLFMQEGCAHGHWDQLNQWICNGLLPCDPKLAAEPDPICVACQFSKAHCYSHLINVSSITEKYTSPGASTSTDGLEVGSPGWVFFASKLHSTKNTST
jgi:hypothetical protein